MNINRNDKFAMFLSVRDLLDGHAWIWSGVPVVNEVKRDFDEVIQSIVYHYGSLFFDEQTLEMQKEKMKRHLAGKISLIAGALQAYAVVKEDEMLQCIANLQEKEVYKAREEEIAGLIGPIIDEAKVRQFDLNNFGISGSMIREVESFFKGYLYFTGISAGSGRHRKHIKPELDELFFRGDYLLNSKLDKLIIQFKEVSPDFYRQYLDIRIMEEKDAVA